MRHGPLTFLTNKIAFVNFRIRQAFESYRLTVTERHDQN